jgi:hypothetical protein
MNLRLSKDTILFLEGIVHSDSCLRDIKAHREQILAQEVKVLRALLLKTEKLDVKSVLRAM